MANFIIKKNNITLVLMMVFAIPSSFATVADDVVKNTKGTVNIESTIKKVEDKKKKKAAFNPMQAQIISFEESTLPSFVKASENSKIKLTEQRYINGKQSLVWDWTPGDILSINKKFRYVNPQQAFKAVGRQSSSVFSAWIYNEKASDGELTFKFGGAGGSQFTMKLDFEGWRSPGLAFHRDMQGSPSEIMNGLTITANNTKDGGRLYIDRLMISLDDIRYQWSDDLVSTQITVPEIDYELPKTLPQVNIEERKSLQKIKTTLIDYYIENAVDSDKAVNKIRKTLQQYRLYKNNGVISGVHLLTKKQLDIYQQKHLSKKDQALVSDYIDVRYYTDVMLDVARLWSVTQNPVLKQEMADSYILMSEHLLDQGFQNGSSLVSTHHWGYSSRGWYASLLLMEEPLRETGLLKPIHDALLWYSREFKERGFDMKVGPNSSDMDYYNTLARAHIIMLLLEDNEQEQVALLKKFSGFISGNLSQTPPGYADGFRPDGTAFRHRGNYPGYSFSAFDAAAHVAYILSGTPFELSNASREYLKKVMLAARVYSNPNPGVGTNGRRPFFNISLTKIADAYRWAALAGTDGHNIDNDLARAYLRISGKDDVDSEAIFGQTLSPEDHPQGAYTYNYAAMGVYRHNDKMITMKGWNRYVWSAEIYNNANRYGRYQSHGSVQIQKWGDEDKFGYRQDGWDWNRMPGATTIHLPWKLLDAPRKHTTMLHNKSRFSGATDLDGKYGAFGFILENPNNWPVQIDPSFTAKKSVFSFDDRLILVGSDITNNKKKFSTETTLFQYGLTDLTNSLIVSGKSIDAYPYKATLTVGDWLIDGMGNGYLVAKGGTIHVRKQLQESRHNITRKPTFGHVASAWIDHGNAPQNAEYEYMIVLDATPEKMAKLAKELQQDKKPYQVIRKDGTAHIVHDKETGVTGYTAYKFVRTSDKWVRAISTSAVVMIKADDKTLQMSIANPDLNMEKNTHSQIVPVSVTLKGTWELSKLMDNVSLKRKGAKTVVTAACKDGIPIQIQLKRV